MKSAWRNSPVYLTLSVFIFAEWRNKGQVSFKLDIISSFNIISFPHKYGGQTIIVGSIQG